jgi:Rrf2 family protein
MRQAQVTSDNLMSFTHLYSQRTGYALHTLCYMARKPVGTLTTGPELASWMRSFWVDASETYLTNVIQRLVRGDLLRSQRGKSGGYCLSRHPSEITLRDVICELESVETDSALRATTAKSLTEIDRGLQQKLHDVEAAYLGLLDKVTVEDLCEDNEGGESACAIEPAALGVSMATG